MADNTYQVEYSKTDRASCKDTKCKQKIGKDVLRIGKEAPSPFGDGTILNWYHASCAFRALTRSKSGTKKIDEMDDLVGHEGLSSADKKYLTRLIDGEQLWEASGWSAGKSASKSSSEAKEKPSKKRKASESPKRKAVESPKAAKKTGKVYLEYGDSKFWEIELDGSDHHIRFGKLGHSGATQTKSFGSKKEALAQMEKLIKSKKKSGYKEVGGSDDETSSEEEEASESSSSSSEDEEQEEEDQDWQWQDEDKKWHSYSSTIQEGIKNAIKEGHLFYKFEYKGNFYRLHIKSLYQINTVTSVKRKVRV